MSGNRYKRSVLKRMRDARGFSMLELAMVMGVILIVSAIAIPQFTNMQHVFRLRGAATDFAGLVQAQRVQAIDDDRYYSTYILAGNGNNPQMAFVDMLPRNPNGTSGSGGQTYACSQVGCDPSVIVASEVVQRPAAAAPNTGNLQAQLLPVNSPVVPQDGGAAGTPITFGPRGLPCIPVVVTGATVCDSLGGPAAYWIFFQDSVTQNWTAVTVTPAGRVRRWLYTGGAGGTWTSY